MTNTVAQLYRYPVKSMLGETLGRSHVDGRGLLGDRGYAVVDASDGVVASAKVPAKWSGLLGFRARYTAEPDPGAPLPTVDIEFPDGSTLRSDDPGIDGALSAALGRDVRLSASPVAGNQFEEVWPEIEGLAPQKFIDATTVGREVSGEARSKMGLGLLVPEATFFDIAVLHLITTATLARLGELAPDSRFDPLRYRPNVLIDVPGSDFVEDDWVGRTVLVGGQVGIPVSMLTMRCVMTTLAQGDLPEDRNTLRTIAKNNRKQIPDLGTWACAGVYAGVADGGELAVGDPVEITG